MNEFFQRMDDSFQGSFLGRYFELDGRKSCLTTEFRGAVATFMAMSYILAVNPGIMADSGGPCTAPNIPNGIFSPEYEACVQTIKRQLITSTAIGSMFGCLFMGGLANLPIALAPGMGLNAYFTYTVVGFRGTGKVSYEAALTAVLIEGFIFLVLAVTGVRYALIRLVPEPVRIATPAAIGCFLAHLGLQTSEGLGIVVSNTATAVTVGGCPPDKRSNIVAYTQECATQGICVLSDAYVCDSGKMTSPTTWVGILGLMLMLIMLAYKKRSAFVVGISFITVISWFRNTAITYFPYTPAGDERFDFFKKVVNIEPVNKVFAQYSGDLHSAGLALFTFLYVDFLDASGTLLALTGAMGIVDSEGKFPRARMAFSADASSIMFGSLFGLSPVTAFIESGAGIEAGSRTGLTSCFVGFFFFLSIFFSPIIASIPPWATGGALVIVGALMAEALGKIKWYDITHAATAFLTVIIMPLTYSIAYGLLAGILCYCIMTTTFLLLSYVGIEKPVFLPPEETHETAPASEDDVKKEENLDMEEEEIPKATNVEEAAPEQPGDK